MTSGPAAGRSVEIDGEVTIGREGVDLTIEDDELSRRHAVLRPVERGVEIEDLGSLNGTSVNGERITGPVTLTSPGNLKLGTSTGEVEISMPQVTRMAAAPVVPPAPDMTRASDVPGPEVTRAREIPAPPAPPAPDVTRAREVPPLPTPDVTAPRAVPTPDVTAPRSIPTPDVTAPRSVPPPKAPDKGGGGGGGRGPLLIAGVVAAAVAVAGFLLLSGGDEGAEKRPVRMSFDVAAVTPEDKRNGEKVPGKKAIKFNLSGQATGRPFGAGTANVAVTIQPVGPPKGAPKAAAPPKSSKAKTATITPRFTIRFPGGTILATERLASRRVGEGIEFEGTGRIMSGTGDFEGARGTFDVTGRRAKFDEAFETFDWKGSVEF